LLPSAAVAVWKRSPLGRDYRRLWVANVVSVTGDGVTVTAGPLLAASITHDPLLVAGALFAQQLPWLIFGPLSGALVDRLEPTRLIVIVDLLRAAAVGGLAASVFAGRAHLAALYGALFILGVGSTVSDTAVLSLPPLLVGPDDLVRANAGLQGVLFVGADLVGPLLGAYLFVLAAGLPFAFDAATFVVGAALIASIRRRRATHPVPDRTGLRQGAVGYGVLLACGAAGGVIGTVIVKRLLAWFGTSLLLRVGLIIECATHVSLALTHRPWVAALTLVIFGVHGGVWNVATVTLRQKVVPEQLLGRVNSVYNTFSTGGFALGSLVGGLLARGFGLTAPFWVAAAAVAVVAILAWRLFTPGRLTTEAEASANCAECGSL